VAAHEPALHEQPSLLDQADTLQNALAPADTESSPAPLDTQATEPPSHSQHASDRADEEAPMERST
jgi:hypothetical protein